MPHLADIETPALVVDLDRLRRNIESMRRRADRAGVRLRPHIKTHKSLAIARMQLDAGAVGITCATIDEAMLFIEHGITDITLAHPQADLTKLSRLLEASTSKGATVGLIADSITGVEVATGAADRFGVRLPIYLKIDVGLHRCGVQVNDRRMIELAYEIAGSRHLQFAGILSHAGHAYAKPGREAIATIAREEQRQLGEAVARIRDVAIDVESVSAGATPTILAADDYSLLTELRPGNYVFLDRTQVELGVANVSDVALSLVATIVSRNATHYIIDAGSKSLSSDVGPHGTTLLQGYGIAWPADRFEESGSEMAIEKLSEEHGFVRRGDGDLPVGSRVRILPNHACTAANMFSRYVVASGEEVVDEWSVDARR